MTCKRRVKQNLIFNNENKDTINSPTVIADMFIKKCGNFSTFVEGPTTQDFKEVFKIIDNIDDNIFASPNNMADVFNTVSNLKNNKAVGIDGVSAEVLKFSLLVFNFFLIEFLNLSLLRGCLPNCLRDAKVDPLHKSGDIMNINIYKSISILPAIIEVFEKIMYGRINSFFDKKSMFCSNQFDFRSKRSTIDAPAEVTEQIRQKSTDTFTCLLLDLRKAVESINHQT